MGVTLPGRSEVSLAATTPCRLQLCTELEGWDRKLTGCLYTAVLRAVHLTITMTTTHAVSDVDCTVRDWLTGFCNSGAVCLLRGMDWIFIMQVKLVFRRVGKIAKIGISSIMSVRLHWTTVLPPDWIFIKFDIWLFFRKSLSKIQVWLTFRFLITTIVVVRHR